MELLIFITSIPFVMLTIYFFHKGSGTLNPFKINFLSVIFYLSFITFTFLGSILILFDIDNHHMLSQLQNQSVRVYGYITIVYTFFIIGLIIYLLPKVLGIKMNILLARYRSSTIVLEGYNNENVVLIPFILLFFISLFSVIYTFIQLGYYPFTFLLRNIGNSTNLAITRIQASLQFEGIVYIRNIFANELTILLSYIAYIYKRKTKRIIWRMLFLMLFILSISILFYNFAKGPIFWYLLSYIILKIYLGDKITKKQIIFIGVIVSIGILLTYIFVMGMSLEDMTFNRSPLGRVILSQISGLYNHLDIFPERHEFLRGKSFPGSFRILFGIDGPTVKSARVVMKEIYPRQVERGLLGVMSTFFQGEVYGNFGVLGLIFAPIYVGFLFQIINIYFLKAVKSPLNLGLFVYLIMTIRGITTSQFIQFIWHPIVFVLVFFIILAKVKSQIIYSIVIKK
ncbi:MAG: O-antigen polymerase [bacterium]